MIDRVLHILQDKLSTHGLTLALVIAICLAAFMTIMSVVIYNVAGFARYDLSRPGYEKERLEIDKTTTITNYDTSSKIDSSAIDEFLSEYDANLEEIELSGDFNSSVLSDTDLSIIPQ